MDEPVLVDADVDERAERERPEALARVAALAALRISRLTFPAIVTEPPPSNSASVARPCVASVNADLSGDRGPSAP